MDDCGLLFGVGKHKLCDLHEQARVEFQVFEPLRILNILEVLDQEVDAELFQLSRLVFVSINQQRTHVVVVHVVHQRILTQVLEPLKHVRICETQQVQCHSWIEVLY